MELKDFMEYLAREAGKEESVARADELIAACKLVNEFMDTKIEKNLSDNK